MAQAHDGRKSVGIRAGAGIAATMIAIAGVVISTPATQAVAPATDASASDGGNRLAGYFPAQFINQGAEVREHIEAF